MGKLVVERAHEQGHEVVVISRAGGIDLMTRAGLDDALRGVDVVIDVANGGVLPAGDFRDGKITFEQWAASR
ncbi:hypothetical protein [Nonomuraea sp. B19D2]|uniref:hypothetical protein n=1 Tax=Nonomuraea sp. B19D2 TaxID=3159561 RepID=UPI0032D9CA76